MNWKRIDPLAPLTEANTPTKMRMAIEEASMHSAIVRQSLTAARHAGMSTEDTYTLLAYHALQSLLGTQRRMLELMQLQPLPVLVLDEGQIPPGMVRP